MALIQKYKPLHLQAYPSVATITADLIHDRKDVGRVKFQSVLLASENIYEWQKEKISRAFGVKRIFGFYGHVEQVILAPMCEYSDQYHVWPFYGFTEILNGSGKQVEEGEIGELIGISFWSYATPFIRYRTMDLAKKGKFGCEKCGRRYQLLEKIDGRLQELIVTKTGRHISMTAINMHSDVFDHVKQFQFYQDTPGRVTFKIVPKTNYVAKDAVKIHHELMKKLGDDTELEIVFVDEIHRTKQGKWRFLEQRLDLKMTE